MPSPRRGGDEAAADGGTRPPAEPVDESPDVPGFGTWRGVYWFVLGCFVLTVIALTVLTRYFA